MQGGSKTQEGSLSFAEWTQEAGNAGLDGPHLNRHSINLSNSFHFGSAMACTRLTKRNLLQKRLSMLLALVPRQRRQSQHRQGMKRLPAPLHQLA